MKTLFLTLLSLSLLLGATVLSSFKTPVLIESRESKNKVHQPIFNKISYQWGMKKDVWLMRQSQEGLNVDERKWDELSIVIDKTTSPATVSYHQYENDKEIEYRASCFLCHANGPRAIRPETESKLVQNSSWEKLKIKFMNLRIHTYGKIALENKAQKLLGKERITHLSFKHASAWEDLNIPTCLKCHNEEGFMGRGRLKKQHAATIHHLTQTGAMPPWPYTLSPEEKDQLKKFIYGI
jgi:nitrate/TMAO reductase-like tetraheme cytochrome c subunit